MIFFIITKMVQKIQIIKCNFTSNIIYVSMSIEIPPLLNNICNHHQSNHDDHNDLPSCYRHHRNRHHYLDGLHPNYLIIIIMLIMEGAIMRLKEK